MTSIAFNLLYKAHKIKCNVHLSMIYTFRFLSASGTLDAFCGLGNVFSLHAFFLYIFANEFKIEHFLRTANRLTQWYWESDGVYSLINVIVSK